MLVATTDSGVIDDADGSAFGLILAVGSSMGVRKSELQGCTANNSLPTIQS